MTNHFTSKVVWITGASSGIGEALATHLAGMGATLVLSARREDELLRVGAASGIPSDRLLILPFDVTDHVLAPSLAEKVISRFGKIDILVNNAGISSRGLVEETDLDVYKRVMDVDFFSTVALTKAVLPHMITRKEGQIVVVSSLMGKFSTPWRSAYCAAKHALHGFYDSLRAEIFRHNLAVTVICPGFVKTSISFNALNNKGENRRIEDNTNKNGLKADYFALKMLSAIARKKDEAYIGSWEVRGVYAKRFLPSLLNKMMRNFKPH
ncbi:MAG: SDR family oxidoreductase [Bacteroidota bacterium]